MSKTIQLKKPELEIKRKKLLQNEGQLWKQQLELQDRLLEELSTAQGEILKNEVLLNRVVYTKNIVIIYSHLVTVDDSKRS